ncbi:MAG: hypothetical protein ACK539_13925 [Planctomycetota bacterium]
MTLANDFQQLEVDLAELFGRQVTLTVRTATGYAANGTVTETTATQTVQAEGPVRDVDRYGAAGLDQSITATWYVPGLGLTNAPKKGDRISYTGAVWQVIEVETYTIAGVVTGYRCDCGEVAL